MEEIFDNLAKDASAGLSRRQVFRRFGWGLAMAAFASVGLKAGNDCGKLCAECCNNLDFPPRGPDFFVTATWMYFPPGSFLVL